MYLVKVATLFRGGNCFCGERKCEKYPKNKQKLLLFLGGNLKLGGGGGNFPPLKALKKTLIIVAAASDQANTVAAEPAAT